MVESIYTTSAEEGCLTIKDLEVMFEKLRQTDPPVLIEVSPDVEEALKKECGEVTFHSRVSFSPGPLLESTPILPPKSWAIKYASGKWVVYCNGVLLKMDSPGLANSILSVKWPFNHVVGS